MRALMNRTGGRASGWRGERREERGERRVFASLEFSRLEGRLTGRSLQTGSKRIDHRMRKEQKICSDVYILYCSTSITIKIKCEVYIYTVEQKRAV